MKRNDFLRVYYMNELEKMLAMSPAILNNVQESHPSVRITEVRFDADERVIMVYFTYKEELCLASVTYNHLSKKPLAWLELYVHRFDDEDSQELEKASRSLNKEPGVTMLIRGQWMVIGVDNIEMSSAEQIAFMAEDLYEKKVTFMKCCEKGVVNLKQVDSLMNLSAEVSVKH